MWGGVFLFVRRHLPLVAQTRPSVRPLVRRDQVYDTLLLAAPGALSWTDAGVILVHFLPTALDRPFAVVRPPASHGSIAVAIRDGGRRYALIGTPAVAHSVPYAGQTLSTAAVFEYWSGDGTSPESPADLELTISYRTQVYAAEDTGTQYTARAYLVAASSFPTAFPISL